MSRGTPNVGVLILTGDTLTCKNNIILKLVLFFRESKSNVNCNENESNNTTGETTYAGSAACVFAFVFILIYV